LEHDILSQTLSSKKTPLAQKHTLRQREVSLAPEAKPPAKQSRFIHKYESIPLI